MGKYEATWLRSLRKKAGFAGLKQFAHVLDQRVDKAIGVREAGGWERCDNDPLYRDPDKVPFEAIVKVLNERLPEDEQVAVETLRRDHWRDVGQCEAAEERLAARIDEGSICEAIGLCDSELTKKIYDAWGLPWQASNPQNLKQLGSKIADQIRSGEALKVTAPLTTAFDACFANAASLANKQQIWRVVETVARACVVPVNGCQPGKAQSISTDLAWLLRIRLLAEQGAELNGMVSSNGREVNDDATFAFKSEAVTTEQQPIMRVWELVNMLVERYDPARGEAPNPLIDRLGFDRYCELLSASLAQDNLRPGLFFHLMIKPESDEVTSLLYATLGGLMSFSYQAEMTVNYGLLVKPAASLEVWLAEWMYKTGNLNDSSPNKDSTQTPQSSNSTTTEESKMQSSVVNNITVGEGSHVAMNVGGDGSTQSLQQTGLDTAEVLQQLKQLIDATDDLSPVPVAFRNEVRGLQTVIEETGSPPDDLPARLEAASHGLVLGQAATTILVHLKTLWQGVFGAGL